MKKEIRRNNMLSFINDHGIVTFDDLKDYFPDVSEMTLRTDLRELDLSKQIIRIRGGAKSIQETTKANDLYTGDSLKAETTSARFWTRRRSRRAMTVNFAPFSFSSLIFAFSSMISALQSNASSIRPESTCTFVSSAFSNSLIQSVFVIAP